MKEGSKLEHELLKAVFEKGQTSFSVSWMPSFTAEQLRTRLRVDPSNKNKLV